MVTRQKAYLMGGCGLWILESILLILCARRLAGDMTLLNGVMYLAVFLTWIMTWRGLERIKENGRHGYD